MNELSLYKTLGYEFLAKLKKGMYLDILVNGHPIIPIEQLEKLVEFINDIYLRADDNIDEEYYFHVVNTLLKSETPEQIIKHGKDYILGMVTLWMIY